jgi:hypothetical protein
MEACLEALLEMNFCTKPPNFGVKAHIEAPAGYVLTDPCVEAIRFVYTKWLDLLPIPRPTNTRVRRKHSGSCSSASALPASSSQASHVTSAGRVPPQAFHTERLLLTCAGPPRRKRQQPASAAVRPRQNRTARRASRSPAAEAAARTEPYRFNQSPPLRVHRVTTSWARAHAPSTNTLLLPPRDVVSYSFSFPAGVAFHALLFKTRSFSAFFGGE